MRYLATSAAVLVAATHPLIHFTIPVLDVLYHLLPLAILGVKR